MFVLLGQLDLLDESPTSANIGNDHGFIKNTISIGIETFWGSPKQSHESLCSKWTISYHHIE